MNTIFRHLYYIYNFSLVPFLFSLIFATAACNYDDPNPPTTLKSTDTTGIKDTTGKDTTVTDTTKNQATVKEILMQNVTFNPADVTITKGTTVRWVNKDAIPHTATSDQNLFDSGNMNPNATFEHKFDTPGSYGYYCRYHQPQMRGNIIVQ